MELISIVDRNKLYRHVQHDLGAPIRPLGIEKHFNDMMDSYFEMALEDYSAYVNEWLIEQQWVGLQGLEVDSADFTAAFATKSNDFMRSFTFAYSKQVGLGTNAPAAPGWELKRDYIVTSANTQHYIIPAGREVNEVLWETPPEIDRGLVDPFAVSNWSAGQFGWMYMGRPAQFIQPAYSMILAAQDRRMKERLTQSDLTYRITGLEDGRKLLHLYPIPGSRFEIRDRWGKHYAGRKVWYWYYDTTGGERDKCLEQNSDAVRVLLPSDAPINLLPWGRLNSVARQQVRDLLIARAKIAIGGIRGFYSGEIGSTDKSLTMDYRHLLDEGKDLRDETKKKIMDSLEKISLKQLTEDRASIAENVNKERGYQPLMKPIMVQGGGE
jgi:hypothetical protein